MKIKARCTLAAAGLRFVMATAAAQVDPDSASNTTVIGPRNPFLAAGAEALINGDARKGIELTKKGLKVAQGSQEKKAALSNLCAGYLMIDQPQDALSACNEVIALDPNYWRAYNNRALVLMELGRLEESEADVARGQELRPNSRNLSLTRARLLDRTDPVEPTVEVDERRSAGEETVANDKPL